MPTRIDIELTSTSADGSWTWRAAGAREPKGVLDGSLLPPGATVGDELKAETEHDVDGIRILSIIPPKQKAERSGVLELLPTEDFEPVVQHRAGGGRREGGQRPRRGRERRERHGDEGEDRRDRRPRRGDRRQGPREGDDQRPRDREDRPHRPHFAAPPEIPQRPKPKRLRPGKQHRAEVLASIPEEQRPVAELALQGIAAVRQRVREDNVRLKAEQKPEMPEATVLKMAEEMLPKLRVADWLDRAEAADRQLASLDLRDLRSVVAAADDPAVARDESTRELATKLKEALTAKQIEELNLWLSDVEAAVDVGRVIRALRTSAMPPKAGVPFPAGLGAKLGEATNAALTLDDPADRWIAVLEAAAFSPVRSLVSPAATPPEPSPELVATVTRLGPLLPNVAEQFGIEVPERAPTPKPLRPSPRRREAPKRDTGARGKDPKMAKDTKDGTGTKSARRGNARHPEVPTPDGGTEPKPPSEQPAADADRPVDPGEQPAEPREQPADPGEQPAEPGEQPADLGEQPADLGEQPADLGEQPPAVENQPTAADGPHTPDQEHEDTHR